jgi:hypothetical protein
MVRINYWAVVVAAVAAFVMSSVYYSPFGVGNVWHAVDPSSTAGSTPSVGKVSSEIVRTLVITYVLARLIALLGVGSDWTGAVRLAIWLWFGFSAMMWVGAIHSGDWLLKTLLMAVILGVWRK